LEKAACRNPASLGSASDLYFEVHGLLRELSNPNLHAIANMNFRVELWDRFGNQIRWVVAAAGTVSIAHAAFEAAITNWPNERFTLRQGIMLIREHPPERR
jgi:hypothetical protein